jgi:hypothetical protein
MVLAGTTIYVCGIAFVCSDANHIHRIIEIDDVNVGVGVGTSRDLSLQFCCIYGDSRNNKCRCT